MNLMAMQIAENRRTIKMTVLHRKGGTWHRTEIDKLVGGLHTEASQQQSCPEYLVLFGHHTKEQTLKALGGGQAYAASQIVGIDNKQLPFVPGFI